MFNENRVLRRMFGLKWEEVTGSRKLHNESFRTLLFTIDSKGD
jgi:hypothetical protein